MASKEQIQEIANRGLQDRLSPERRAKFDELVSRGIITVPAGAEATPSPVSLSPQTAAPAPATETPVQEEAPGALRAIPPEGAEGPTLEDSGLVRPLIKGQRGKPISPFVAAIDRGIANVGEGVQQAGLEALNKLGIVDDSTLADFNKRVTGDIEAFKEIEESDPATAAIGQILGEVGASAVVPGGSTFKGATAAGTVLGGAQFVPEGGSRAEQALTGGLASGATSAALKTVGKVAEKATGIVKGQTKKEVQELEKLGKEFNVQQSVGDITGQPLIKKAEVLAENIPVIGFSGFRDTQQKQVARAAGEIVDGFSVNGDWAKILQTSLVDKAKAVRLVGGNLFTKVGSLANPKGNVAVPQTNAVAKKLIAEEQAKVPEFQDQKFIDLIQKYTVDPQANFTGVRSIRSDLSDDISDFFTGKNAIVGKRGVDKLQQIKNALDDDMGDFANQQGGQIKQAWDRANSFWKKRVIPFKDTSLAKAATTDTPDEIFKTFIKRDGRDRSQKFFNALDKKGKEAVRSGILENAFENATREGKPFSAAKFAQSLEQFDAPSGVFFKGADKKQLDGFKKLLRHVERSGQFAENPPTGQRVILALLGTGAVLEPGSAGVVAGTTALITGLFGTAAGKRLLLSAGKFGEGTKALQNAIETFSSRTAAATATTPP